MGEIKLLIKWIKDLYKDCGCVGRQPIGSADKISSLFFIDCSIFFPVMGIKLKQFFVAARPLTKSKGATISSPFT